MREFLSLSLSVWLWVCVAVCVCLCECVWGRVFCFYSIDAFTVRVQCIFSVYSVNLHAGYECVDSVNLHAGLFKVISVCTQWTYMLACLDRRNTSVLRMASATSSFLAASCSLMACRNSTGSFMWHLSQTEGQFQKIHPQVDQVNGRNKSLSSWNCTHSLWSSFPFTLALLS